MSDPVADRLADATFDRRRLKRRLVWWRAAAIIAIAAFVAAIVWFQQGGSALNPGASYIARVTVAGVIEDDPQTQAYLQALAQSGRVAGVIVSINSPGGTFSGSEALHTSLRRLAEAKPTVAVIGGMAASGGYMAAIAADHIVARQGSVVGSVGVIFQMPQVYRLLDDLGIDIETIRSGDLKATPGPMQETSRTARQAAEGLVDDLFSQFLGMVTDRRPLTDAAVADVRRGGVYTGRAGLEIGLIDAIGGEDQALQWLEAEGGLTAGLPVYDRSAGDAVPWWAELMEELENRARLGPAPILDGPWAIWHR